jgi:Putative transposase/Transposase zinc-binding domain
MSSQVLSCPKVSPSIYRPRRPEKTVFYQVTKKYYKTWVKKSEKDDKKIPFYIHREFQGFIKCGILAHGFACAHCEACNHEFLVGFSCKLRLCPSCCGRGMAETAAHIQENVIGQLPVRQWVVSFPKRIRYYLQTDAILQKVLRIVAVEIRNKVIERSPKVTNPEFGAVSFIQRFGNTLNFHPHFHFIVADGVFEKDGENLAFHEAILAPDDIADAQEAIEKSVIKLFNRRGWFNNDEAEKILSYENTGFSLDAKVKIQSWDREGLEKLIRYCARPSFASENLRWNGPWLVYRLPKPCHTGKRFIQLDPIEFIDKIAALIPPARRHRHHYHGAFAPNAPLRLLITEAAIQMPPKLISAPLQESVQKTSKVSFTWARLIARIYETNPLLCSCGKEMKITKIITDPTQIWRILTKICWPTTVPDFDEPQDLVEWDICQLVSGSADGFPEEYDPPHTSGSDPPDCHFEDNVDPPHWEDICIQYD